MAPNVRARCRAERASERRRERERLKQRRAGRIVCWKSMLQRLNRRGWCAMLYRGIGVGYVAHIVCGCVFSLAPRSRPDWPFDVERDCGTYLHTCRGDANEVNTFGLPVARSVRRRRATCHLRALHAASDVDVLRQTRKIAGATRESHRASCNVCSS